MQSQTQLSQSLARLSSGSKINTPADDSAGLAVSMNITAQIGRNTAANDNVNNAISFNQTQDGYLQQVANSLNRISELAVQAQDVIKSDSDRSLYQQEFNTLANYISSVSTKDFNGVSLFGGDTLNVTIDSDAKTFGMPAHSANRKESSPPAPAIPHGHGERILFVDDEPIVGRSTEELLKRLGYIVTRCGQSEEALARFRQSPRDFDLIITDWAMPGMSGTELVSAMHEVRPDILMLLVSGFVGALLEETAKKMGIGEILVKPVNPELLAQTVDLVLSRAARTGNTKLTRSSSRGEV
jgi:CheY-like chemotaxis protein